MLRRLLPLLALVLATTTLAVTAAAQEARPTIRSQLSATERQDWDAAVELYEARNYQAALVQFRKVYESSKNARVLYNIGVCEKDLHNYARAKAAWERQLTFTEALTAEDRQSLDAAIRTVEPFVSTLEVEVDQPGATVFLKGEPVAETPLTAPIAIDVGQQTIRIEKEGFKDQEIIVDVRKDVPAKIEVRLEPSVKKTRVTVEVTGGKNARVFIDGVDMGPAPFKGPVLEGRHTFEARALGYETARQTSDVKYGKPLEIKLNLAVRVNEGKVKITTGHKDAEIIVDARIVGRGTWEGILPAGGHQLVVQKPGYERYSTDISLRPDQVRTIEVVLTQERGTAWVWWTVTSVAVVGGTTVAAYFVLSPSESAPVNGTLGQGIITTGFEF